MIRKLAQVFTLILSLAASGQESYSITTNYTEEDGLPSNQVYAVAQDNLGFIWFGTDHGLSRFDGQNFVNYSIANGAPDSEILKFYKDSIGQLWCYTLSGKIGVIWDGKILLDRDNLGRVLPNLDDQITDIVEYKSEIFVSTTNQIGNLDTLGFTTITKSVRYPHLISNRDKLFATSFDTLLYYYDDSEKQFEVLFETKFANFRYAYGISYHNHLVSYPFQYFESYIKYFDIQTGTSREYPCPYSINNIQIIDDEILVVTTGGILKFYPEIPALKDYILVDNATSIHKDTDFNKWVSSYGNGVVHMRSSHFEPIELIEDIGVENIIIAEDSLFFISKKGFVVSTGDLNEIREIDKFIVQVNDIELLPNYKPIYATNQWIESGKNLYANSFYKTDSVLIAGGKESIRIYNLHFDGLKEKSSWVNVEFGQVQKIVHLSDSSILFFNKQGLYEFLISPSHQVLQVSNVALSGDALVTNNEEIWYGTYGKGIQLISAKSEKFMTTNEGLSSDYIQRIIEDDDKLWVLTSAGIDILDIGNLDSIVIKNVPTFTSQINDIELFNDEVLVASDNGLFAFSKYLEFAESNSKFIVESFEIAKEEVEVEDHYSIYPYQREFGANYAVLNFEPDNNVRYRYSLIQSGESPKAPWIETEQNSVVFSNVRPDQYQLVIEYKVSNSDWKSGVVFNIEVVPKITETLWFWAVISLIGSAIMGYLFILGREFVMSRNRLKNEKLSAELMAKNAQLKPHFVFNALNAIRSYVLENNAELSDKYLTLYASLMRKVLNASNKMFQPIEEELSIISMYLELEQLRFHHSFKFEIVKKVNSNIILLCPSMILQPFVENAVMHGVRSIPNGGLIKLEVEENEEYIRLIVGDNGNGFEKADNRTDLHATDILKDKVDLMRQTYNMKIDYDIKSCSGQGTEVTISFEKLVK